MLGTLCSNAHVALAVADIGEDRGCAKHDVALLACAPLRAVRASSGGG
jgi:hypothetical protein